MSSPLVQIIRNPPASKFEHTVERPGGSALFSRFHYQHDYYSIFFFHCDLEKASQAILALGTQEASNQEKTTSELLCLIAQSQTEWTLGLYALNQKHQDCLRETTLVGEFLSNYIDSDLILVDELKDTLTRFHRFDRGARIEFRTIDDGRLTISTPNGRETVKLPKAEKSDYWLHFARLIQAEKLPMLDIGWVYSEEVPTVRFINTDPESIEEVRWFELRC